MQLDKKKIRRILITRTDRIGDVVLSTPAIENIRLNFPDSYIAFLTRPYDKPIVENNPFLDEVIIYDKYGRQNSFWQSMRFARQIRKKEFDVAFILHPTNRVNLMTFFAGIPVRIGWNRKMGFLLTHKIKHLKQNGTIHERDYTLQVLREAGLKIFVDKLTLVPAEASLSWAERFVLDNKLAGSRLVGLGIGASCSSKVWPAEKFAETARMLKDRFAVEIIIFGSEQERWIADRFKKSADFSFFDLAGRLSLDKVIALISKLSLFVSNDSGLVHIASALDVPVVAIFSRNQKGLSPRRWRPLGDKSFFIHKPPAECVECLAHKCQKGFLCLQNISAGEVFDLAKSLL